MYIWNQININNAAIEKIGTIDLIRKPCRNISEWKKLTDTYHPSSLFRQKTLTRYMFARRMINCHEPKCHVLQII